jgi:hypothetical protein
MPARPGSNHSIGEPVDHDRLASVCHLRKQLAQVVQDGDEPQSMKPVALGI